MGLTKDRKHIQDLEPGERFSLHPMSDPRKVLGRPKVTTWATYIVPVEDLRSGEQWTESYLADTWVCVHEPERYFLVKHLDWSEGHDKPQIVQRLVKAARLRTFVKNLEYGTLIDVEEKSND